MGANLYEAGCCGIRLSAQLLGGGSRRIVGSRSSSATWWVQSQRELLETYLIKTEKQGQGEGSPGKGACCQA